MSLVIKISHLIFILPLMAGVGRLWTKRGPRRKVQNGTGQEQFLREPQPLTIALCMAGRGRSAWTSRPQGLRAKHMSADRGILGRFKEVANDPLT